MLASLLSCSSGIFPFGSAPVHASPPPWAPAHGYRKKQPRNAAAGETNVIREQIVVTPSSASATAVNIETGSCNRETIGALLGGAVGGVLGSAVGNGDGRTIATIGGTLIGIFVGKAIGRHLDEMDKACVDRTLEYAPNFRTVTWSNPETGTEYWVTPKNTYIERERRCRDYTTETLFQGSLKRVTGTACRDDSGLWVSS